MANKTDQHTEGNTSNDTVVYPRISNKGHIDALEVESSKNAAAGASSSKPLTFDQASSIGIILSLVSYLWLIVKAMMTFSGFVFSTNQYELLYYIDDDTYETYMSYWVPLLVASILFFIAILIQIYVWFAKSFVSNLRILKLYIFLFLRVLCFAVCINMVIFCF